VESSGQESRDVVVDVFSIKYEPRDPSAGEHFGPSLCEDLFAHLVVLSAQLRRLPGLLALETAPGFPQEPLFNFPLANLRVPRGFCTKGILNFRNTLLSLSFAW
jgi:hypothetical protein